MKKCPFCGAEIAESARFCLYCMQSLTEKEQISLHQKKKPQRWIPVAAIIALVILATLFLPLLWEASSENPAPSVPTASAPQNEPSTPPTTEITVPPTTEEPTVPPTTEPPVPPTTEATVPPTSEPPHSHSFSVKNTAGKYRKAEATCTAPAVYYFSCACGEKGSSTFSFGEVAPHSIVTDLGYPATCVDPGLTDGSHCAVCNMVLLAQTQIPVVNHTYDNDRDESCNICGYVRAVDCDHTETVTLPAVSPTCTTGGLTEGKKCALCEDILTVQINLTPLGHTEVTDQAIPPTCTADGKTEGKHCSACHAVLMAQVTVTAKGHTEVIDQAIAPTCTASGKTEGKHCSVCQLVLVYQQYLAAKGHSFDPENLLSPCSVCGAPSPHTHSYSIANTNNKYLKEEATCSTAAVYYYSCTCGEKGSNTFSHGNLKEHTIVTDPGYPADCTNPGLSDGTHCSACHVILTPQQAISPPGHTFSDPAGACTVCGEIPHIHSFSEENIAEKYLKQAATCTTSAIYYYSCPCGEKGYETFYYGTATSHTIVIDPGYPAGCTTPGLSDRRYCSVCNDAFEYASPIPAKGHAFTPGDTLSSCLVCGEEGNVIVQTYGFTDFITDSLRINSCTYKIQPAVNDTWEIIFTINYTNFSSNGNVVLPAFYLYFNQQGYWTGHLGICDHVFAEAGTDTFHIEFRVPNASNKYVLVID